MQPGRIVGLDAPGIVLSPHRNTMRFRYPLLCALAAFLLAPAAGAQTIVINEILYDPPSDETGDANGDGTSNFAADEFVEIINTTNAAIDISGYTLSDDDGGDFAFPAGTSLAAGQAAVLFGGGTPTGDFGGALVFVDDGNIGSGLSNTGDLIQLKDASGTLLTEVGYGSAGDAGTASDQSLARSPDLTGGFVSHSSIGTNPILFSPGKLNTVSDGPIPETYLALLLGANEVPPVTTAAAGGVTAVLTGTELVVTGRFDDLESDYNASIGSHLHGGAVGENGPVRYALTPTLDADNRGGTFEKDSNTLTVRATFADSLRNGLVYVNIHTVGNPTGEIRGQVLADSPTTELSLRQVRIVGPGFSVSTTGTVSRALGAFAYIQTDNGGLAIRQTSGAFSDEIAAGTIAPGTQVTLSGTLSESNGALQINGSDLDSYSTAAGTAPEATAVTLAELLANGEFYEGRLVTVQNVTFSDMGTFDDFTTYEISDGTNDFDVRLNNAGDTDVDGTAIPSGPATVTGVIGEFRGSYQFLPIRATDVRVFNVSNGEGVDAALSLSVANPLRSTSVVRFELAAPGRAQVALFDALGRQVATLVDRAVGAGEQTVQIDAASLASGVYVLRLQAQDAVISRTVTVVR